MEYSNSELTRFVNRIKLSEEKKRSYSGQIDNLKDQVVAAIDKISGIRLLKVKRSGSWKKGTALAPRGTNPLDIDMVFFIEKEDGYKFDAEAIRKDLIDILCAAYPNKSSDDFTNGKKTIGVVFRGSGLEVDIVPFIPEGAGSDYGLQPEKTLNSGTISTSIAKQLEFSRDLRRDNREYPSIVRILKHWRNEKELNLPSFALEILVGKAIYMQEITGTSISDGTARIFEWLGRGDDLHITFGKRGRSGSERPWISDPANDSNNVVARALASWSEIEEEAEKAWETLIYARTVEGEGRTRDLWKEVMGPRFNTSAEDN
ncbi:MAG: CBASS oligonucleotide cyclase [Alphaproteobacteria bacterium]|nr:CBASS oligonucleotide cyclase [Alphaproteobacteria bacterium]